MWKNNLVCGVHQTYSAKECLHFQRPAVNYLKLICDAGTLNIVVV